MMGPHAVNDIRRSLDVNDPTVFDEGMNGVAQRDLIGLIIA
jgi:hypothetical protein